MGSNPTPRTNSDNNIKFTSKSTLVGSHYSKFSYSKTIDFTVIQDFRDFCSIDKQLSIGTVRHYTSAVMRLLSFTKIDHRNITVQDIR